MVTQKTYVTVEVEASEEDARRVPVVGGRRREPGGRGVRNRRAPIRDEEEDDFESELVLPEGKVGAKKLRKLQEKEEKRRQREADLAEREDRKKREEEREKRRRELEEIEKLKEEEREEDEKRLKEEQERREHEEYLKLKEAFSIDEEGEDAQEETNSESLLQEFIDYIQQVKVVMLEDLAAQFKIKTQDAIDRINTLQEDERLTGVLDDRGKFIFITRDELQAVADFIRRRGRVSITELAEKSNNLIDLTPAVEALHALS
ncbi:DgyrCDS12162 [Dimorphilus gyrociliatus]|uniref:DDRGK domain-containing protein 1 n=1 Tax=Dimorphilus gyrociliatus TaxID=2664684 RepID=A0A7I8W5N8_9ANNE|nr:DgyrCDS12162 [Dimorphilus gyrociliatus]